MQRPLLPIRGYGLEQKPPLIKIKRKIEVMKNKYYESFEDGSGITTVTVEIEGTLPNALKLKLSGASLWVKLQLLSQYIGEVGYAEDELRNAQEKLKKVKHHG